MSGRTVIVTGAIVVSLGLLAGCGGSGIPRTKANLALCGDLAKVLDGRSSRVALADAAIETNAPNSPKLVQDVLTYVAALSQNLPSSDAAMKAEADCGSIDAPMAKGYAG